VELYLYAPICCCDVLRDNFLFAVGRMELLFVCSTWSVILRKVHKLQVFENRVTGKTSEYKKDEVISLG
jgi:hypothetical protein